MIGEENLRWMIQKEIRTDLVDIYERLAEALISDIVRWSGTALSGRDITADLAKLEHLNVLLSSRGSEDTLTALLGQFSPVYMISRNLDLTVAQSIVLDPGGRTVVETWGESSVATTFRLDASEDGDTWIEDFYIYPAVTSVKEGYSNAWRFLRLRSDVAGGAGDLVSLGLAASR